MIMLDTNTSSTVNIPNGCHPAREKIAQIAKEVLSIAYSAALVLAKAVIIPIEATFLGLAVTCVALNILLLLPKQLIVDKQHMVRPLPILVSAVDFLAELIKITYYFGLYPESEEKRPVKIDSTGPRYVVIEPKEKSTKAPILYAPGYFDNPTSLRQSCRSLAEKAKRTIYIVEYRSLLQSIEEHAKDVQTIYDKMCEATGQKKVVLVGHSMGGLNCGRFIQNLADDKTDVERWVTIASPLQGTPLAHFGIGACADEMKPGSSLLKRLNEGVGVPSLHIYSEADTVVPPASSVGLENNKENSYKCNYPYSHLGVRSSSEVELQIVQFLDKKIV